MNDEQRAIIDNRRLALQLAHSPALPVPGEREILARARIYFDFLQGGFNPDKPGSVTMNIQTPDADSFQRSQQPPPPPPPSVPLKKGT
jgi:hypothetical protein